MRHHDLLVIGAESASARSRATHLPHRHQTHANALPMTWPGASVMSPRRTSSTPTRSGFANRLFEPAGNANTSSESTSSGTRPSRWRAAPGPTTTAEHCATCLQDHVLQILCLVAMERRRPSHRPWPLHRRHGRRRTGCQLRRRGRRRSPARHGDVRPGRGADRQLEVVGRAAHAPRRCPDEAEEALRVMQAVVDGWNVGAAPLREYLAGRPCRTGGRPCNPTAPCRDSSRRSSHRVRTADTARNGRVEAMRANIADRLPGRDA